ncbi:hypothetical protein JWG42_15650 [Desulfoprunum benzoelyticum]|uniref:O-antigen/teichoic acid export membrane protein n=1 Tax=Desulfoprunum benzoelyticum TaxID=1506996 RepID=A0A840UZK2_9BACT|nr:hypothetical protein [Desulfoprunum benzoelyticum]MBB5348078.1 O-antigen/teichoic acid export membrane protein [Desulfoprunum benzoelyticum]MBM9531592.1 hypothetical protein [Desulfoprunum benzoelyticum]
MTDFLSTSEIKKRSIKGAKWLVVMNVLGMPAAFLIALMLGRVGPAVLGMYALAQILISVITTFVVYGGAPVLSVFMPKITQAEDRGRFVFSYLLILIIAMAAVLGLFWLYPKAFEFLLQREFDMRNYGWFVLLSLVIVATETFANAAAGLMLIKVTAIARQMMRLILLPLVTVLFFFNREILVDYGMPCILGGFLIGYMAAAVISAVGILRDPRFTMRPGWFLPPGFWAFSLSAMTATVFTFMYGNFDRMVILSIQNVEGLGMYQAVISLSSLIGLVPQILGTTLVPMFSSLLASGKMDAVQKTYALLQRLGSFFMTGAALFLISFSGDLLSLFGRSYSSYDYLLSLFSVQYVVTSLHFGNTPILTSFEKNTFRLTVSFFQILLQIVCTLLFIKSFGVLAIAGAKIAGVVCANMLSILFVRNSFGKGFSPPISYKFGVGLTIICAVLRNGFFSDGLVVSTFVFIAFSTCYLLFANVRIGEIKDIITLAVSRNALSRPEMRQS